MSDEKILCFDSETGGVEEKETSLLSLYFGLYDENFKLLDYLDLYIKPNKDGVYRVTAGALNVNHIDIVEHDKIATAMDEAKLQTRNFLKKHSDNGKNLLIPMGHSVDFDFRFIFEHLLRKRSWDRFVSYRKIDTSCTASDFKKIGLLPKELKGSLVSLAKYFGIDTSEAHTAKRDTEMTIAVYQKMIELAKSKMVIE